VTLETQKTLKDAQGARLMTNTVHIFVPVGKPSTVALKTTAAADRQEFVIGLLDNHKHGSTEILNRLQERLTAQFGGINFVRHKKGDAGKSAGLKIIEDLAGRCGVVVNGVAD
jgi:hypothetical protein